MKSSDKKKEMAKRMKGYKAPSKAVTKSMERHIAKNGRRSLNSTGHNEGERMSLGKDEHNRA